LFFLDLFPSTSLIAYSYHALGLALLAGLWWSTAAWESRRLDKKPATSPLIATVVIGLLLGFSRPYEPIAFLGAWLLKAAWHWTQRKTDPVAWRTAAVIASILLLSLGPGIGWSVWISRQPVWSAFAHQSLTLGLNRMAWVWTLGGWAILTFIGLGPAFRANSRLAALPVSASLLCAVILLGFGAAHTKLASGLIFGPLLLSGWGAARIVTAFTRFPWVIQLAAPAILLGTLFGIASLFMNLNAMKLNGPALVDEGVVSLAGHLPFKNGQMPPVVLTDTATGAILPGLAGARVWAGHWSLSSHYDEKVARLKAAGLDPASPVRNSTDANHTLEDILTDAHFDFALIDRRCVQAAACLAAHGWLPLESTGRWRLLKAPPASP
jgi:hypothetical protein